MESINGNQWLYFRKVVVTKFSAVMLKMAVGVSAEKPVYSPHLMFWPLLIRP